MGNWTCEPMKVYSYELPLGISFNLCNNYLSIPCF